MVPRFAFYTHKHLAVRPLKTTIQPSFSTIPCKILYLLANPVLLFSMLCTQSTSPTNRSPLPRPFHSNRCHPGRSEVSAFRLAPLRALSLNAFNSCSPFPFNIPTFKPSNLQLTPFSCDPVVNPFPIRTSAKRACNPCRMRSFKIQDLKPFRMCSYEKTGEGGPSLKPLRGFASTSHGSPVANPSPFVPRTQ
jgi:hypothetical protein